MNQESYIETYLSILTSIIHNYEEQLGQLLSAKPTYSKDFFNYLINYIYINHFYISPLELYTILIFQYSHEKIWSIEIANINAALNLCIKIIQDLKKEGITNY